MKKSLMLFVYWLILFAITLSGSNVYSASTYEAEPNENRTTATPIAFGNKIVGNMWHALDYDWYKIENVPEGLVSLTAYYEFPSGATADTDVLYVEIRDKDNKVLSDFFIDYMDHKTNTPYIRDINIPSTDTYYVVVHCPSQAKFKRYRYYISMAKGAGENATVKILNEEDTVSLPADEKSADTITAFVRDENGDPVEGAMVIFSRAFGDTINPKNNEFVFSNKDIKSGDDITDNFFIFSGDKDITFTYSAPEPETTPNANGVPTITKSYLSYFKVELINTETGDKIYLYSTSKNITNDIITKDIPSDGNYYLKIVTQNGEQDRWEIKIPNKNFSTITNEIGTAITDKYGEAKYKYRTTDQKGDFTIIASFGNSSDKLVIKQTAGSPTKVNIIDLVENPDNDLLYVNREYTLSVAVTDKNSNLVEDGTEINLRLDPVTTTGLTIKKSTVPTKNGMAKFTISASNANKEYKLIASVKNNSEIDDSITLKFNTITLSNIVAQPVYMLADGKSTSTISVRLSDINGIAVADEPITFSVSPVDCGSLLSNTAKTNDNGIAQVTLVAPLTTCTATVTAAYGTKTLPINLEFYGDGTGSTTGSIDLEVSPKTIPANGKSSVVITAALKDNAGNNVPIGTPVQFETTKGMFPNTSTIFKGSTTIEGIIKVSLISKAEDTPGNAIITCSSGGIKQLTTVTFVRADEDGSPVVTGFIKLTANPASIPISTPPKYNSLMITAELFDTTGSKPVPAGTPITFYADKDKAQFAGGLDSFTAATTDDTGKVSVALRSLTTPGTVDVWCLSNGVYQLTTVTFTDANSGPSVGSITLTANPTKVSADGASSTSITATITDSSGKAVPSGTSIIFTTTPSGIGKFANGSTTITVKTSDDTGKVIVPLISAGTTAGFAQVTASSGGVSQGTLVTFEGGSNPTVGNIKLTAEPTSIPADGASSTSITATVTDATGKSVPLGTSIIFTTTPTGIGKFANGSTTITVKTSDDTGKIVLPLISAGTTAGFAEVTATCGGVSQKITVTFKSSTSDIGSIILTATPNEIPADGLSSASIKAEVKDTSGKAVPLGTTITFTTTLGKLNSSGAKTITVKTTDATSGAVTVSLISEDSVGTATVTASVGTVSQSITISFIGASDNSAKAKYLYLSLSKNSVLSDNLDTATITASVLDNKNAAVQNVKVNFSLTAGKISSTFAVTDINGNAPVIFSSGPEKKNQTVIVTASVNVNATTVLSKSIPIVISGSTLTLDNHNKTSLEVGDTTELTVIAKDGAGKPIQYAEITAKATIGLVQILPDTDVTNTVVCSSGQCTGKTDFYGELDLSIKGISAGKDTVEVRSEEIDHTIVVKQEYSVIQPEENVQIIYNADSPNYYPYPNPVPKDYNVDLIVKDYANNSDIKGRLKITVIVPKPSKIGFFSTLGKFSKTGSMPWEESLEGANSISTTFDNQEVIVYFSSDNAGIASIYVVNLDNTSQNDSMTATISASSEQATQISLQASPTIVAPSSGDIENLSVLTATVKNSKDQPVKGAMVIFSIINTVGGGEKIVPGWAITDSSGIATSKFISGSLPTGGEGIKIEARINNTTITDEVYIVIGGTPGSIVIGRSTVMESAGDSTQYILPMSILVSDSGGHPVAEKEVSLNIWPIQYAKGYFIENPSDSAPDWIPKYNGWYDNEDVNRNTILDAGESDIDGDGITPPNSSAGNIPSTVKTDKDGVANFDLIYLKHYAVWINAEIRATTIVSGTETISSMTFILPALQSDTTPDLKLPSVSPFGSGE